MLFRRFRDREEAGKRLAEKLLMYKARKPIVLAIPRGGVVIAHEIAKALEAPMDLIIPRKIGAPGNPELAIGAVTDDGTTILNKVAAHLGISEEYVRSAREEQVEEIKRRARVYRGDAPPKDLEGRTVIIVDDGIATGATMRAAIHSVRRRKPSAVVVAVPVGPPDTVRELEVEVDELVCLAVFEPFFAIGQFYEDFRQVSDEEVVRLMRLAGK